MRIVVTSPEAARSLLVGAQSEVAKARAIYDAAEDAVTALVDRRDHARSQAEAAQAAAVSAEEAFRETVLAGENGGAAAALWVQWQVALAAGVVWTQEAADLHTGIPELAKVRDRAVHALRKAENDERNAAGIVEQIK